MKESLFDRIAERILCHPAAERIYAEKVKKELRLLYPAQELREVCRGYYRKKLSLILKIFCVGVLFILLVYISERMNPLLEEGNLLQRGAIGENSRQMTFEVRSETADMTEITYDMRAQLCTPDGIKELVDRFSGECESLICGENESFKEVHTDLCLKESYEGYPMEFSWESSDYALIREDGTVKNEDLSDEQFVELTVCMTYEEEMYEHTFNVCVVPPKFSEEQIWKEELLAAIRLADKEQRYSPMFRLPTTINGKDVRYKISQESSVGFLLILLPVVLTILFYAKDRDLDKEVERRKKKMSLKYPEFVSKFQLLLGAGMTVRNVFVRLSEDMALGEELHEELVILARDMKNGMSVRDALDRFGKRTANPLYMKFTALLIQNIKKGTDDLLSQLSDEMSEAFSLRKAHARQLGEEAGTKLLAPMILMLAVVMAVLMIPAFLSFQF